MTARIMVFPSEAQIMSCCEHDIASGESVCILEPYKRTRRLKVKKKSKKGRRSRARGVARTSIRKSAGGVARAQERLPSRDVVLQDEAEADKTTVSTDQGPEGADQATPELQEMGRVRQSFPETWIWTETSVA